ncbi:thioredoxin-like protein [Globomyces pollinis-pini]|nr:thioredoxin-like protein [Globomyces pollinis-pini]
MVQFVKSESEFDSILKSNALVICDFTASWCGPCKAIAPVYDQLAKDHSNITFIKVDVDEVQSVSQREGVTAMPTFVAYLRGSRVNELRGADKNGLNTMIQTLTDQFQAQEDAIKKKKGQMNELANQPVVESEEELMTFSIKDLKKMIVERGWSLAGLAEKRDLVNKLKGKL